MTRRTITALTTIALCVATVTGCGSSSTAKEDPVTTNNSPTPSAAKDPEAVLRERTSFEAAQQQYTAAVTDAANQIAALVPGVTWTIEENSWRGCGGDFVHTKGVQAYILATFSGPTPDPMWQRALGIVEAAATQLGATSAQAMVDRPANHEVVFSNPDGVEVTFGTAKATVLSAKSECLLRQKDTSITRSSAAP